ncbi:MAG: alpha/beta hydrolase [Blastocatellia bacterium]
MQPAPFHGEEHLPFYWEGDRAAVLLVHGFPGTPAEMRPLATSLREQGMAVEGLLLPGFGHQIESLGERTYHEWTAAIAQSLLALRQRHERVLLIGFSMGAALSLSVATSEEWGEQRPDGLVLLAPFWQLGTGWQAVAWPVLRRVVRHVSPFAKADLRDPKLQRQLTKFMPDADFEDPATIATIRAIRLPFRTLDQLRELGLATYRQAPALRLPTLVIQGKEDAIVSPAGTRRLIGRFASPPVYHELPADHQLLDPEAAAWPEVERLLHRFAQQILSD